METVGFAGGGRITRILLGGWARRSALPARVLVHEPSSDAVALLRRAVPTIEAVSLEEAAAVDVLFLALHPPVIMPVLSQIRPMLRPDTTLVSFAPKIPLAVIAAAARSNRVVRMIPNAASLVGRGFNPLAFGDGVDVMTKSALSDLFAPWGEAPEVPEEQLEAYAILTGMGPTYFWFQFQALREIGVQMGIAHPDTDRALRAMLDGTLRTLLDAGLPPAEVMDLIPVKPMAEVESGVDSAYRALLPALHAKIQPAVVS